MPGHPAGRGGVEQIAVVLQLAGDDPLGGLRQPESEVELRRPVRQRQLRDLDPGHRRRLQRRRVQLEDHLEEGGVAEAALGSQLLDDPLERQLRVRVGLQRRLPRPPEQRRERGVPRGVDPQRQGVDEEADQPLELHPAAPRRRRPHHQVGLPGVAMEQRQEAGQRGHERGDPLAAAGGEQPCRQVPLQPHRHRRPPQGGQRRARPVGRQLQGGRMAGQLLAPVGERPLQRLPLEPPPLPEGEVGVLQGQLRQRRRLPRAQGVVEDAQLAQHHPHRPAVRDDVVHREHQDPLAGGEPQQQRPQQRTALEIERPQGLRPRQPRLLGGPQGLRQRRPGRPGAGSGAGGGSITWTGPAALSAKRVRSASCRRTISPRAPASAAGASGPRSR